MIENKIQLEKSIYNIKNKLYKSNSSFSYDDWRILPNDIVYIQDIEIEEHVMGYYIWFKMIHKTIINWFHWSVWTKWPNETKYNTPDDIVKHIFDFTKIT